MTMRVLLDCRMSTWTGVGRYTVGLTRALAALQEQEGFDLVCVVRRGEAPPAPNTETVTANFGAFGPMGMVELGAIQGQERPDVTHCLHFPTPFPAQRPLAVTLHDLTPLVVDGVMPAAWRREVYRAMNRRVALYANAIITPSAHTASDVERLLPKAAGKTRVTLEGVDDFAGGPRAAPPAHLAEAAPDGEYILAMGSTRAHKNLATALTAFASLAADRPTLRLFLVGAERPGYLAAALPDAPDSVRERIVFTGAVSDAELRTLYAGAAVFAFPSRYEGFGLPPLEAMALGAPVVCSDAASLPEVVGDAALMHAPDDASGLATAIARVLDDPPTRDRLIAAGNERAAQLTWRATALKTLAVYRELHLGLGREAR